MEDRWIVFSVSGSCVFDRMLLSVIESQRRHEGRMGSLQCRGLPSFILSELRELPRIKRMLELYEEKAWPKLLEAALQGGEEVPFQGVGSWTRTAPCIRLRCTPNLRFMEICSGGSEVKALIESEVDPCTPAKPLPPHAFSVVSYSISSDISHGESPKAADLFQAVQSGELDEKCLSWSSRQQRIRRQVLLYSPDIICLQGLQSIGFAARCSDSDPEWFEGSDEPAFNHLVHLFRELSKENYAVAFAPTILFPGSEDMCFGNAIFWKRSRWELCEQHDLGRSCAVVELVSRLEAPRLLVCSSKAAIGYAKDWGDDVTDAELLEGLVNAQCGLSKLAQSFSSQSLWAGEFGCDTPTLLGGLEKMSLHSSSERISDKDRWTSAVPEILGRDVGTLLTSGNGARTVDLILCGKGLQPLAALGGLEDESVSLPSFLQSG